MSLRSLHDVRAWEPERVAAEFARNTGSRLPKESRAFLEGFLRGARRCSCKTNRFCSCLMPGCAILVERTSLILFHCSAEACRVSTQLRGAGCSRKFSADSNKA